MTYSDNTGEIEMPATTDLEGTKMFFPNCIEDLPYLLSDALPMPLVYEPSTVLHTKAANVLEVNDDIRLKLLRMLATMYENHGIGLAGPQVNIAEKLVVIDIDQKYNKYCEGHNHAKKTEAEFLHGGMPLFMVNPKILEKSPEMSSYDEGCLSAPGLQVKIERPKSVKVQYLDFYGKEQVTQLPPNLISTCFQHEYDHITGVTIVDYLSPLKKSIYLKKLKKFLNQRSEEDN